MYGGRFVKLVVYINHKSLPGPKVSEKPRDLCNVCKGFKTILSYSSTFQ